MMFLYCESALTRKPYSPNFIFSCVGTSLTALIKQGFLGISSEVRTNLHCALLKTIDGG